MKSLWSSLARSPHATLLPFHVNFLQDAKPDAGCRARRELPSGSFVSRDALSRNDWRASAPFSRAHALWHDHYLYGRIVRPSTVTDGLPLGFETSTRVVSERRARLLPGNVVARLHLPNEGLAV